MADESLPLDPALAPETPLQQPEAPTSYTLSAEEYNSTLQGIAALQADVTRYSKYKERIDRFESDPEFNAFYDQSETFFKDGKTRAQQQQAEEAPSWFKPYAQAIDEFRGDRQQTVNQTKAAEEASLNAFYAEQHQYGRRLMAEHKLSQADINELGAIADTLSRSRGNKRVGLEEAFRSVSRFSAGTLETPPPVLRQTDGVGGVPAPSPVNVRDAMKTRDGARATIKHYLTQNERS